ncbi:MAG: LD-carboxypeptidase, partial [Bacteroidales bacterium]|nr:LD-carboxypeptidase [Bacteroidales bacterium]
LWGEQNIYEIENHEFNRKGKATGELVGGNLSVLYSVAGTKYDINTSGKILVLEDLDEYLYHIDRMMMNLKYSGKLGNLKGLMVGGMTDMNDNQIPFGKSAYEIIRDAVDEYNYPVCFNFPLGHIEKNYALILGNHVELNVEETGVLFKS